MGYQLNEVWQNTDSYQPNDTIRDASSPGHIFAL